jgi:sec-independent protein translocase protein TatA
VFAASGVGYHAGVGSIGGGELLVVLAIILVLFGGAKLPKLARSLGQAQKEFKDGLKNGSSASTEESDTSDSATSGDDAKA